MRSETKRRILDAAERLFGESGFDATSLRAITSRAGVNIAAVNYHFTSKEALIRAVIERNIGPLNATRLELLSRYEAAAAGRPVPLEQLVRAFVEPVLRLGPHDAMAGFKMVLGRMYADPNRSVQQIFVAQLKDVLERFVPAFRRTLPELPRRELLWNLAFLTGMMAHTLAAAPIIDMISGGLCDTSDIEGTIERLVRFAVAGLKAPAGAARAISGRQK